MTESQRIRDQKALTTSTGRAWLVVGALLTGICGGLLAAMWSLPPAGVAVTGAAIVVACYVAMIVVRFSIRRRRARLIVMAVLAILAPVTFVICAGIISIAGRAPT